MFQPSLIMSALKDETRRRGCAAFSTNCVIKWRNTYVLLLCGLLLLSAQVNGLVFGLAEANQSELNSLQRELKSTEQHLRSDEGEREKTYQSLEQIERDISTRQQRVKQALAKKEKTEALMLDLQLRRQKIVDEETELKQSLGDWIRMSYQLSLQNRLKLVLSDKNPADIDRANQYYGYIAKAQRNKLSELVMMRSKFTALNSELEQQSASLDQLLGTLEADQNYLSQLGENRRTTLAKLEVSISDNKQKLDTLKARERRLKAVLNKIAQARAKRAKYAPSSSKTIAKAPAKASARFPMPLNAPLLNRFGQKRAGSDDGWTGLMLDAKAGETVKAVQAGEVVYADWLRGYGLLMIIDHGGGLKSLYGHNQALLKKVGDRVVTSDAIAEVGDTAGLEKAALYFEIRLDGKPQDPLRWCKLGASG